jgi:tripartite-type tricarboxylate transporter receptor subunit TctC
MKKILLVLLLCLYSTLSLAKDRIELIVASAPGGAVHRYALHIQPILESALGKNVVITFKPGGNGFIAARELQNSPKNQLTFLMGSLNLPEVWKENLGNQKFIDVRNDITPVAFLGTVPSIIFSRPTQSYSNFKEALIHSKKENLTLGLAMNSANVQLIEEILIKSEQEKELTIVPFKSGGQGLFAVLGGHVNLGITVIDILTQEFERRTIVPLALIYESRLKSFPAIPTLRELGLVVDNEDRYYNNFFIWSNADKNSEEVIRIRKALHNHLNDKQSEKFLSSMFVQFGKNDVRQPEKYLEKLIK